MLEEASAVSEVGRTRETALSLKEIGGAWTRMPLLDQGLSWLEGRAQHLHWSTASSGSAWSLEHVSHLSKTIFTSPGHMTHVPVEGPGCC